MGESYHGKITSKLHQGWLIDNLYQGSMMGW